MGQASLRKHTLARAFLAVRSHIAMFTQWHSLFSGYKKKKKKKKGLRCVKYFPGEKKSAAPLIRQLCGLQYNTERDKTQTHMGQI
jgi:hypothetical protein